MSPERSGAGWIVKCGCGWERYEQRRPVLDAAIAKHACPKVREKTTAAPRARADWNTREDSTWIDKL